MRHKCILALLPLYDRTEVIAKLELFTNKFKDRLVSMVMDKDNEVAMHACQLLTFIYRYCIHLCFVSLTQFLFKYSHSLCIHAFFQLTSFVPRPLIGVCEVIIRERKSRGWREVAFRVLSKTGRMNLRALRNSNSFILGNRL